MENINMTHVFKHPKFYRIPRDKTDQAISLRAHDGECERASDPGHKPQATSSKLKETSCLDDKNPNPQASSDKLQAPSRKHQAPSRKRQAP
jgi:hypothetical protein